MALLDAKTVQLGATILMDVQPDKEHVRIRIGDSEETVKKVDLWAAIFAIADAKTQEEMMPVRQTEVMTFERIHNVRIKKDTKANTIVKVRCHVDVPVRIEENLKGLMRKDADQRFIPAG